jgi:hypothetical protein
MKKIYEFYYEPFEAIPHSIFELHITNETKRLFAGDVFNVTQSGRLEPCGKFRLGKGRVGVATAKHNGLWMARCFGESRDEAERCAKNLLCKCIRSWASDLLGEEESI